MSRAAAHSCRWPLLQGREYGEETLRKLIFPVSGILASAYARKVSDLRLLHYCHKQRCVAIDCMKWPILGAFISIISINYGGANTLSLELTRARDVGEGFLLHSEASCVPTYRT